MAQFFVQKVLNQLVASKDISVPCSLQIGRTRSKDVKLVGEPRHLLLCSIKGFPLTIQRNYQEACDDNLKVPSEFLMSSPWRQWIRTND